MTILLVVLMLAVLGVLLAGVITMARGGDSAKQNKLMIWRVALQGTALLVLGSLFLFSR